MPKRKAPSKISGLVDSDDEDIIQLTENENLPANPEAPAKKRRGRPRISHEDAPEPKTKAATAATKQPAKRGRPRGSSRAASVGTDGADDYEQENEDPAARTEKKTANAGKPAATRGRGRPRMTSATTATSTTKQMQTDGEFEFTPTGTRKIASSGTSQALAEPRGSRRQIAKPEVPESQREDEEYDAEDGVDETVFPDPPSASRYVTKNARARITALRNSQDSSPRKRRLGMESEPNGGDPDLRRRLGELTKKHDALEIKYRNLREIGIVEANSNMEKLRKQCENVTTASNELIASLKSELEAQRALGQQSRGFQKQLKDRDTEMARLQAQADEARNQLASAQSEIKTLGTKLAAARNTAASLESAAKAPGSAIKGGGASRATLAASAEAAQVAQLKEDLYSDLTGLIVRDVKTRESDHLYDCIQTGVNGSLHFKLAIPMASAADYETAEFQYLPLLDANRDRELVDILPDFLTVDITFNRQQASKFYTRVMDALTKRRSSSAHPPKFPKRVSATSCFCSIQGILSTLFFLQPRHSFGTPCERSEIMARLGRLGFLTLAVVFHLIYTYSIFDIYFVSPIVRGMRSYGVERPAGTDAPAKRLVLFVADGLRADKAFQAFPDPSPESPDRDSNQLIRLAPFIRSQVLSHGTFGVSHTRVPTESRPGHVALIAGLYEDVSAVTTGWKMNPVNFDSVFNQSRHTWSWGSPDILPMFKEGAVPGRVDAETYSEEAEDFTVDATHLDTWLRDDKLVFFLHLLGLDTTGHAFRPYSKEYLHNIKIVDKGVQSVTKLVQDFYGDGKTAFVFTADHGMSDKGSHGDGHPDNTRTPLVAWGSGVASPKTTNGADVTGHEDGFSSDWGFDQVLRHDVAQADVAALMAYLVGLDYPVNSVGQLPLAYLDASPQEKAMAALANTRGVLEMYRVKEEQKREAVLRYVPFEPLSGHEETSVEGRLSKVEALITNGAYEESIALSSELLSTALEGLRYLQTYDWLFLRTVVSLGYLGWIAYALTSVIDLHVLHGATDSNRTMASTMFFSSILVVLFSVFLYQGSSWRYYFYGVFPVYFWEEVFARRKALTAGREIVLGHVRSFKGYLTFGLQLLAFLAVLEALVQSYFHREIFTVCFALAVFWPTFYGMDFIRNHVLLSTTWAVASGLMATFTLLPVTKMENIDTITYGAFLMFFTGVLYLLFEDAIIGHRGSSSQASLSSLGARIIMGSQIGMILLALVVTRSSVFSLQARQGLPFGNLVVGWFVLVASLASPFLHRLYPNSHYLHRLMVLFLTFSPTFIILAISYEGLFYFVFCMTLVTWVRLEHAIYVHTAGSRPVLDNRKSDTATATSAFFSTGNVASVSTFSLDSVVRLVPVFNPFSQAALLIFQILIPFAIISANLGILNRRLEVAPSALFMVVMALSDVMTLNFFYMVRDEGSWLDIGMTISHFCIASFLCTFVAGLEFLSELGEVASAVEVPWNAGMRVEAGGPPTNGNGNGELRSLMLNTWTASSELASFVDFHGPREYPLQSMVPDMDGGLSPFRDHLIGPSWAEQFEPRHHKILTVSLFLLYLATTYTPSLRAAVHSALPSLPSIQFPDPAYPHPPTPNPLSLPQSQSLLHLLPPPSPPPPLPTLTYLLSLLPTLRPSLQTRVEVDPVPGQSAMSTTTESYAESYPANHGSPAPSAAGSTGTSGITVRGGPNNSQMSFRRFVVTPPAWASLPTVSPSPSSARSLPRNAKKNTGQSTKGKEGGEYGDSPPPVPRPWSTRRLLTSDPRPAPTCLPYSTTNRGIRPTQTRRMRCLDTEATGWPSTACRSPLSPSRRPPCGPRRTMPIRGLMKPRICAPD
ncbi:glycosyl phosphatidyl inositol anchor synthesis [Penicillium riverlandense]|uniref:glycosyl phosphatidyl inositol anchor synthesis n=1 Tax=Penicillium riverlandense TaxID=1903569 RepID=UPI00254909C4|nr:glycosyl phosphatidyl inositol anchor synthesis [Penicillium riverlandense]KAJ5807112.1 glycosyl phosphatidyl inositol anchor synthesis [Penicillium riverlandense]